LIICDLTMQGLDGFKTKELINRDAATAVIPLIYLGEHVNYSILRHAMKLGAVDYIRKPFKMHELQIIVEIVFSSQRFKVTSLNSEVTAVIADFVRVIKHECNTPLHAIINLAQILKNTIKPKKYSIRYNLMVDYIQSSGLRLQKTLNNIVEFVRLTNQTEVNLPVGENVNLIEVFESIIPEVSKKYDIKVEFLAGSEIPDCGILQRQDLYFLVEELVDNACKFSSKKEIVTFGVYQENDELFMLFTNIMSPGTTKFLLNEIKPFKQFNRTINENQGSGLGLYLVKLICELYNIRMSINHFKPNTIQILVTIPLKI